MTTHAKLAAALIAALATGCGRRAEIHIGSKQFTESVILGEMAEAIAENTGLSARHHRDLGGTRVVWEALLAGEIDVYPDYTGTLARDILKDPQLEELPALRAALAERGLAMTDPLGFNNTYALAMRRSTAERLGIRTISDLKDHPELRFGLSLEVLDREDGWPGLKPHYGLPHTRVQGLEHGLAYQALANGDIDVMDVYSTDAKIEQFDLQVLRDDREFFPKYEAVFVYRRALEEDAPQFIADLKKLAGRLNDRGMTRLNALVDNKGWVDSRVAHNFLVKEHPGYAGELLPKLTDWEQFAAMLRRVAWRTGQHLFLVGVSLAMAIAVAIPLGIVAAKKPKAGHVLLGAVEIVQTIPALALLVLLMPPLREIGLKGTGPAPAIVALFLYALLPIMRNTHAGITALQPATRESALALGLSPWARLWLVELPLASRFILAGIKTTVVIIVGYATLGGLISAGGYGQPIFEGYRQNNTARMLEGAIPAALLALAAKGLFELAERCLTPRGLRLKEAA